MKKFQKHYALAMALAACCMANIGSIPLNAEADGREARENSSSSVAGDVNGDGEFGVADLVRLNSWLHSAKPLENPENADLNGDGDVNVFDLAIMRKKLIKSIDLQLPTSVNLSAEYSAQKAEGAAADAEFILAQTKFSIDLLKNLVKEDENTFISPYSVMQALAMTTNGAAGDTRSEMENTLGGIPIEKLNAYLLTQRASQPLSDECKLTTANSVWARNDFGEITPEFLQKVKTYYDADFFKAPFDKTTTKDVNNWVNIHTDGMIKEIIDEIPEDVVTYLINAVTFDAKWDDIYTTDQVGKGKFTAYDGTVQTAETMYSTEHIYLEDENATGFMKPYEGGRYAFAALLPKEGMTVTEYINTLTSESLNKTFANRTNEAVITSLPKFRYDYSNDLSEILKAMGMENAFTSKADFTNMTTSPVAIGSVIHKTHIDVFEEGTKAAAVTSVAMCGSALIEKSVYLNRPFVYAIVDTQTNLPIFIGTLSSVPQQ